MQGKFRHMFCTLLLLAGVAPVGRAEQITGTGGLGSYSGTFDYGFTDATHATLTVSLTNTSADGFLTAFAFNNPGGITGVTSTDPFNSNFSVLGGSTFDNSIAGSPYGNFDIGASTSDSWLGGGSPTTGIAAGGSATFTFALTGTGLDLLSTQSFLTTLSDSPEGADAQAFIARFRGFTGGGSDKVPGSPSDPGGGIQGGNAPEPGSLALAGAALLCLAGRRVCRRGSKRKPATV